LDIVLGDTFSIDVLEAELGRHFRGDDRIVLAQRVTKHMVSERREACLKAAGTERFYEARVFFADRGLAAAQAAQDAALTERIFNFERCEVLVEKVKEAKALKKKCELDLGEHRRMKALAATIAEKKADEEARAKARAKARVEKYKRYHAKKKLEQEKSLTATLTGVALAAQVVRCRRKLDRALEEYHSRPETCGEARTYQLLCNMWVWSEAYADARKKPIGATELKLRLELVRERRENDRLKSIKYSAALLEGGV
jgi:hypothetical protein